MERGLSTLLAVAALALSCCLVSAQFEASNETTTEPPSPPVEVGNQTFIIQDAADPKKVCLRMTAVIVVNITYINKEHKNVSMVLPLTDHAEQNRTASSCNSGAIKAMLYVEPSPPADEDPLPYHIIFEFTGSNKTGDQHWAFGGITFVLDTEIFDGNLSGHDMDETLRFPIVEEEDNRLYGSANNRIEFNRSYTCNTNQGLRFNTSHNVTAFIYVSSLQAQAFRFKNETSGAFDNSRTCVLDSGKANKIVPIAVGAALAGLVVVVLIAYLIGRLRSRRQSSYEALS